MRLVPERSPLPRLLAGPLLLMLTGGLLAVRLIPDLVHGLSRCPLRDITGVPCPTCGGTHAAAGMAAGRWLDALQANPIATVGLAVFTLWAVYGVIATLLPRLRRGLELSGPEKKAARYLAAFLILASWAWQIARVNLHWV